MSQILTDTLESMAREIRLLKREVSDLRRRERGISGGGGVTDHGLLTGLGDNDHPQYAQQTGATFSGQVTVNDRIVVNAKTGSYASAFLTGEDNLNTAYSLICRNKSLNNVFWVNNAGGAWVKDSLMLGGNFVDGSGNDYVEKRPPDFWIPPAAFAGGTFTGFGNNNVLLFDASSTSAADTFIALPTAGKRLELTALMTSNSAGGIIAAVEVRYLQEGGGQPSGSTLSAGMTFTINPAYAVRKVTVTLDTSGYAANSTFALRFYRSGAHASDTAGNGYFFGFSGRWID